MENKEFDNLVDLIKEIKYLKRNLEQDGESFIYNILLNSETKEILFKKCPPYIAYRHLNTDKVFSITKIYLDDSNKMKACLWRRDAGDITIDYYEIRHSDISNIILSIGEELDIKYSKL